FPRVDPNANNASAAIAKVPNTMDVSDFNASLHLRSNVCQIFFYCVRISLSNYILSVVVNPNPRSFLNI
ncbi:MAG: hypothetical protein WBE68_08055, partial [Candidatus Nitrosopolaris sp.]